MPVRQPKLTTADRFVPNKKHMGEPDSFFIILRELFDLLGIQGDIKEFMATVPFQPQF